VTPLSHPSGPPLTLLPFDPAALLWGLLLLAAFLLWRRFKKRKPPEQPPRTKPQPARAGRGKKRTSGVHRAIGEIRSRARKHQAWRQGCHELSGYLRGHLDARSRLPIEEATIVEMDVMMDEPAIIDFFDRLSEAQFGEQTISSGHFDGLCDAAKTTFSDNQSVKKKGRG
jgi:hypothetical protein